MKPLNFTNVIDVYGKALIEAGAEGICILEPSGSLLSPQMYEEFSGNYTKELKESWGYLFSPYLRKHYQYYPQDDWTGCDGLSIDAPVDLISIKI